MQKLLYIAPHLSTGGLPQYLTKKIELIKDEFEIYLIEWVDHTGGRLVVQKNKIKDLIDSDKFFTLGEDKSELFTIIDKITPDIIHLEEIPEFFMDDDIARKLYSIDREYFIVESSHDSSYNTNNKIFSPDKFMFVSNWQIDQYNNIDIPKILVEYPIEYVDRPNRKDALKRLNLDPSKKHILHIGLFTSRKNQKEFFEYARALPEYEFHSVGNQADNFKWYWEPLMQDVPDNLTWWDERTDVDSFYQSMDLFLFTSKGNKNDKETMPLVIREAISYQIPVMIYNLEVYQGYFDSYDGVNYLDFNSFEKNTLRIKDHFSPINNRVYPEEEAYVVSTYPVTEAIIETTKSCILSLKDQGRKVILSSHYPIPQELQDLADYSICDTNNILTKHTYYASSNIYSNLYDSWVNLKEEGNNVYHGSACYTLFYNGAALGKNLGLKKLHFINYDYILKDKSYIDYISNILETKNTFFGKYKAQEGDCLYTYFFSLRPEVLLSQCPKISTAQEYDNLMVKFGSESNGLENIYYHIFKNYKSNHFATQKQFDFDSIEYFDFKDFSQVEYYTILPTNVPNHFCPWVQISNNIESKNIEYIVKKNGESIINRKLLVNGKFQFWDLIKYEPNDKFIVTFNIIDLGTGNSIKKHIFKLDKDYFDNKITNNGLFTWKGDMAPYNPKIKLLHLITEPDTNEKEQRSIENLKSFCDHTNIKYDMRVNKIWKDLPPSDTCHRPEHIDWKPAPIGNGFGKLTPGHYGCYLAHKNAILLEDNKDYDFVLIFEGDTIIDSDFDELYDSLFRFDKIANEQELDVVGFGNPKQTTKIVGPQIEDVHCNAILFVPAQSYLIPNQSLSHWKEKLQNKKWEAWDLWIMNVGQMKSGIADKVYTKQLPGFSIIDQENKSKNDSALHKLIFTD
jgi:glycosyltransferase involved in cell wall biosynthesis